MISPARGRSYFLKLTKYNVLNSKLILFRIKMLQFNGKQVLSALNGVIYILYTELYTVIVEKIAGA